MGVVNAVEWVPLGSSVFTFAAYRAGARQLYLRFHGGDIYRYLECPAAVYGGLLAAESKGRYFSQHIRNRFSFEQVHREDNAGSRRDGGRGPCIAEQLRSSIVLAKVRALQKQDAAPARRRCAAMNPLN
jgi:hypothetical protein